MLTIKSASAVIRDIHPRLKVEDDQVTQACDLAITISAHGQAEAVLNALHVGPLFGAMFGSDGRPQLEWADCRIKHRVSNCTVRMERAGLPASAIEIVGCDLTKIRVVPSAGFGLDIQLTIDTLISSAALAKLVDLRMSPSISISLSENQNDLSLAAA